MELILYFTNICCSVNLFPFILKQYVPADKPVTGILIVLLPLFNDIVFDNTTFPVISFIIKLTDSANKTDLQIFNSFNNDSSGNAIP